MRLAFRATRRTSLLKSFHIWHFYQYTLAGRGVNSSHWRRDKMPLDCSPIVNRLQIDDGRPIRSFLIRLLNSSCPNLNSSTNLCRPRRFV
jgi:hypothetical protein